MFALWVLLKRFGGFLLKYVGVIPGWFAGIYVLATFISNLMKSGDVVSALTDLAQTIFAAEKHIHEVVNLAVIGDPSYTFLMFISIIGDVLIIYFLIKWLGRSLIGITGSQAQYMAYVYAIGIVFIVEFAAVAVIDGAFGFYPIWDGIIYLFSNIGAVLGNINWFGIRKEVLYPLYNITTNSTVTNITTNVINV